MSNFNILDLFAEWSDEFNSSLTANNPLCVAIFTIDKKLVFATPAMSSLFRGDPSQSFIHPTFDKLLLSDNSIPLIFEGYLTLGDYSSINASIFAQVYLKGNKILVIGGTNTVQLIEQNETVLTP